MPQADHGDEHLKRGIASSFIQQAQEHLQKRGEKPCKLLRDKLRHALRVLFISLDYVILLWHECQWPPACLLKFGDINSLQQEAIFA
jgi:hypothetical protein